MSLDYICADMEMEWMFLDWDLVPWSNCAPTCAFQVVQSTCELPTGFARARYGAAEGDTGRTEI